MLRLESTGFKSSTVGSAPILELECVAARLTENEKRVLAWMRYDLATDEGQPAAIRQLRHSHGLKYLDARRLDSQCTLHGVEWVTFREMLIAARVLQALQGWTVIVDPTALAMLLRLRADSAEPAPPPLEPAILYHGDGAYSVPGGRPIAVTPAEDEVLRSFLDAPALDGDTLKRKSGVERPDVVLSKLRTKYAGAFAQFVTLPGGKSQGGYSVRIRRAQS